MAGTFYIITGAVGAAGYLTLAQLHWLAAQRDEIGAHTVSHLELTGVTPTEARRQACMSRVIVTGWGFRVTSVAYPGGAADRRAEAIVAGCGFDSARLTTGLRNGGCPGCAIAESMTRPRPWASGPRARWTARGPCMTWRDWSPAQNARAAAGCR